MRSVIFVSSIFLIVFLTFATFGSADSYARNRVGGSSYQCSVDGVNVDCEFMEFCLLDGGTVEIINGDPFCCWGNFCEGEPEILDQIRPTQPRRPVRPIIRVPVRNVTGR
jgi:hypothetical protein